MSTAPLELATYDQVQHDLARDIVRSLQPKNDEIAKRLNDAREALYGTDARTYLREQPSLVIGGDKEPALNMIRKASKQVAELMGLNFVDMNQLAPGEAIDPDKYFVFLAQNAKHINRVLEATAFTTEVQNQILGRLKGVLNNKERARQFPALQIEHYREVSSVINDSRAMKAASSAISVIVLDRLDEVDETWKTRMAIQLAYERHDNRSRLYLGSSFVVLASDKPAQLNINSLKNQVKMLGVPQKEPRAKTTLFDRLEAQRKVRAALNKGPKIPHF